ncbi:GGDEF domain-containing protein [Paraglaciecola marina]|uniref:GGDEF domain-containing protein n=1 Tax=Paraglaciecola marina TaxID=2500157 RepID=UPI001EF0D25A|nr:GGDEF domain-containing protein [Paraglaciecola marina]
MLEQLNQVYDSSLKDSFFNLEPSSQESRHKLDHNQLNQFIQTLLTTIDLTELSELYFEQLSTTLQLSELKIQFEDNQVCFGKTPQKPYIKSLNCTHLGINFATMHYTFSQPVSIRAWQILQQMHMNFSYPFKNALEHHKMKQFAMKDFLTSLGNRASYNETIARLANQADRRHEPFGLLVMDMDNFKQVNDTHGHHEGDKVLVACANTILSSLRESDFAFRFGGDEFCCLLPDADDKVNSLIAERVRMAISNDPLLAKHNISSSIGTATYRKGDSQIGIFSRADEALYKAKQAGKNCVVAAMACRD